MGYCSDESGVGGVMEKQLPNGWKSPKLDELIIFKLGGDWGKEPEFNDSDYVEVRCIRASELRNWSEEKGETAALRKIKKSSLAKRELQAGDILVEISGGGPEQPVGRTVLIDKSVLAKNAESKKVCTNFFRLIRPSCKVNAKYLNIFLQYFYASGKISEFQSGSNNLRNLKFNDYLQINIPLASEKEQKSIVAKIEELFSELDSGIASLKTAREQLKIYRQALLKHAFEGKLTEQWRKDNADKLETPEQLLTRIQTERETRYQQQLNDWKQAVKDWEVKGKEGRKPTNPKQPEFIVICELDTKHYLSEAPGDWLIVKAKYLCDFITKGTTPSKDKLFSGSGEVPFIKVYNLTHKGLLDFSIDPTFVNQQTHSGFLARSKVYPNDVLMNIVGPPLGKVSIVPETYNEWNINQAIAIFRSDSVQSKFLASFLLFQQTVNFMMSQSKATAGQFNLTLEICRDLPIPVPSLLEQQEIVNQFEEKLSIVEQNEKEIEYALAKAELLRQSILKKAFSGLLI